MLLRLALCFLALAATTARAEFALDLPIDCDLGNTCFIQQYVDQDPGDDYRDYRCRKLSYDGHPGTDFRLLDLSDLSKDVAVLAAAPGIVRAIRNDMPDLGLKGDNTGRGCGNQVIVEHQDGYQTQYCHLKEGSVMVTPGQDVQSGTVLGAVGYSGLTQFPHLHLTLRKDGAIVDPFDPDGAIDCTAPDTKTLWNSPPDYIPAALLTSGFAPDIPGFDAVQAGMAYHPELPIDAPGLVLWTYMFGGQRGDVLSFEIVGPPGQIFTYKALIKRQQAQLFRAAGRPLKGAGWPRGTYEGRVQLIRRGAIIDRLTVPLTIR